jgi:hypothetical protein
MPRVRDRAIWWALNPWAIVMAGKVERPSSGLNSQARNTVPSSALNSTSSLVDIVIPFYLHAIMKRASL